MTLRLLVCAPLLLAVSLSAQEGATQDPEKQQGPTPQQELESLKNEKLRLQKEIHYAKGRVADAKNLLRQKLSRPEQNLRSIDAGAPASALAATRPQRKVARVATDEELGQQPEGTMLIVEGRGIAQGFFDKIMDYMREHSAGDDNVKAQRVLFDMIRTEAMAAAFYESEGEIKFGEVLGQVQQGKSIAEIAKEFGSVNGADPEGRVEVTRNSQHGPFFEQVAFTTEPGSAATPFRNAFGYVLLQVDSIEKGATPEQDKAICHVAQILYADRSEVMRAQLKVNTAQIDVIARDERVLEMLPMAFRQAQNGPAADTIPEQRQVIETQIKEMKARAEVLEANGGSEDELEALRHKIQSMQQALESMPATPARGDGEIDRLEVQPVKAPEVPKDAPKKGEKKGEK